MNKRKRQDNYFWPPPTLPKHPLKKNKTKKAATGVTTLIKLEIVSFFFVSYTFPQ